MPAAEVRVTTSQVTPEIWVVHVFGSLDWSNYSRLDDAFNDLFKRDVYRVIVDLAKTTYVSSPAIGCLIGALEACHRHGGGLVLANAAQSMRDLLRTLGMLELIPLAKTLVDATDLLSP